MTPQDHIDSAQKVREQRQQRVGKPCECGRGLVDGSGVMCGQCWVEIGPYDEGGTGAAGTA